MEFGFKELKNGKEDEIVMDIIISRHGPKLSAYGEKNAPAAYFKESVADGFRSMNLPNDEGLTHVTSSPIKRAEDSGKIIKEQLEKTNHRQNNKIKFSEAIEAPYVPVDEASDVRYAHDLNIIMDIQKKFYDECKKRIERKKPELQGEEKEAEIRNELDIIVLKKMFEDSDQNKFKVPYNELADRVASRYLGFLKHFDFIKSIKDKSKLQPNKIPFRQIDVSHSFPITAFLKKYLVFEDGKKAMDISPEEFFEKTGGIIRESKSFILHYLSENGKKKIKTEGEFSPGKKFSGIINI